MDIRCTLPFLFLHILYCAMYFNVFSFISSVASSHFISRTVFRLPHTLRDCFRRTEIALNEKSSHIKFIRIQFRRYFVRFLFLLFHYYYLLALLFLSVPRLFWYSYEYRILFQLQKRNKNIFIQIKTPHICTGYWDNGNGVWSMENNK